MRLPWQKADKEKEPEVINKETLYIVLAGRGETGKTTLGAALAYSFAKKGMNVVYMDQFDAPRAHRCFHLKPETQRLEDETTKDYNNRVKQERQFHESELEDFVRNAKTMDDYWTPPDNMFQTEKTESSNINELLQETNPVTENLKYIIGSKSKDAFNYTKRKKLLRDIQKLDADVVIIDGPPGASTSVLETFLGDTGDGFFKKSKDGVKRYHQAFITVDKDPSSADEAERFIKGAVYRVLERHFANLKKDFEAKKKKAEKNLEKAIQRTRSARIYTRTEALEQEAEKYAKEAAMFSELDLSMLGTTVKAIEQAEREDKTIEGLEDYFKDLENLIEEYKKPVVAKLKSQLSRKDAITYDEFKYMVEDLNSENVKVIKGFLTAAVKEKLKKHSLEDVTKALFTKGEINTAIKELENEVLFPLHTHYFPEVKKVLEDFGKEYPRINFVVTKAETDERAIEIETGLTQKLNKKYGTTFEPLGIRINSNYLIPAAIEDHGFFYTRNPDSDPAKFIDAIRKFLIEEYFQFHTIIEEPIMKETEEYQEEMVEETKETDEKPIEKHGKRESFSDKIKRWIGHVDTKPLDK